MTLDELIPGYHAVKIRRGGVFIVLFDPESKITFISGEKLFSSLQEYRQDLTSIHNPVYDIVEVYNINYSFTFEDLHEVSLVWKEELNGNIKYRLNKVINVLRKKYEGNGDILEELTKLEQELQL